MSVRLGEVEVESEVERQKEGEGENEQITTEKKKFPLFGRGGHEFQGLICWGAHKAKK